MFLNLLNDMQKPLFMELAIKAAEINEEVTSEEKLLLTEFAKELQIEPVLSTAKDEDTILRQLKDVTSVRERKIVVFEVLGIMFADSEYDDAEKAFVTRIAEFFEIDSETVDDMVKILREYARVFTEITALILK